MKGGADQPLLEIGGLEKSFGGRKVLIDIGLALWPGEVLAIVGESGSGKTTLLRCIGGQIAPDRGEVLFDTRAQGMVDLTGLTESRRRRLLGNDLGYVHQNPRDGLRLDLSAGANIAEPLLQSGSRHYGNIRGTAESWLTKVEIDAGRIDDLPKHFSGGMQQRLQIARNLVTQPRLVLMDEPTGGLDVSVQARLLDLLRRLVADLGLAVILVTHDLGVARLLADRLMVMQAGRIVEAGLTDQVLDDPHQPYTQLLVSSVLQL
jgi:putative phosphonate transport system ATP-binding protein